MTPSRSRSRVPVLAAGLILSVLLAPGVGEGQAVRPTAGFRMSDASFWRELGSGALVVAGWVDSSRIADCSERELGKGTVGCQRLHAGAKGLDKIPSGQLRGILRECTWIRDRRNPSGRPAFDCGVQLRGRTVDADLGVCLDSMELSLFNAGVRPASLDHGSISWKMLFVPSYPVSSIRDRRSGCSRRGPLGSIAIESLDGTCRYDRA